MLLFKLVDRALGFVSTVVLARVLAPADFGLIAMAMSVIALIELASAFSLEVALIQRTNPTRAHYDTAWTLKLLFGLLCASATAVAAIPTATFYGDPRLSLIMVVLAAAWLIDSLENIGTVDFRRELDFRREFIFLSSKRLAAVCVTLACALAFRSYWALIAGTLTGRIAGVLLSYSMQKYRVRFSLAAWRDLFAFSGWLFANNVLSFATTRLSHFVIGRTQGAGPLGVFTVANDIAQLASSEITGPINRAVMPGLSRMAEQPGGMQIGLLQVASAVLLMTLPAAFGMAALAEPLVLTLLGNQWLSAVVPVQILAFTGALQSITTNNHSAYLASGKSFVPPMISAVFVAALVPLLVALNPLGINGIALAQLGATAAAVTSSLFFMRHYLRVSPLALLSTTVRPLVASVLMGAVVYQLESINFGLPPETFAAVPLLLGVLAGVAVYVPLVAGLWLLAGRPDGAERIVVQRALALLVQLRAQLRGASAGKR